MRIRKQTIQRAVAIGGALALWGSSFSLADEAKPLNKNLPSVQFSYQKISGLGHEAGVVRRDPSDIIQVGGTYYIWYSRVCDEPGVYGYPSGYSATVWYATSLDGFNWIERGEAIAKGGPGSWDEEGVYTPNILVVNNTYYLSYDGADRPWGKENKAYEGMAVADNPAGPWKKVANNPLNRPTQVQYEETDPRHFDSFRVADACLITRGGRYFWYYKGRGKNLTPRQTNLGLSIATSPEGPYVKYDGNPVIQGGHEVLVWPHGAGVSALMGKVGPNHIKNTIQYAPDGIHFKAVAQVVNPPWGPGGYRPDAFTNSIEAEPMLWGLSMERVGDDIFLVRYECELPQTW